MSFQYTIRTADGNVFSDMSEESYIAKARELIDLQIDFTVSAQRAPSPSN